MSIISNKKRSQNVFTTFINLLGVKYTNTFSNNYFNEHPHKYNLFGLSKMLPDFNIDNVALKLKNREEGLLKLETPFIAHMGMEFAVVKTVTEKQIQFVWKGQNIESSLHEFLEIWTGVVLLAEPDEKSEEPEYKKHFIKEGIQAFKKGVLCISLILLFSIMFLNQSVQLSLGINLLLLFNIVGIGVSYLLIKKQMHVQSSYADKICLLFKQGDCNDVLDSDAAKLFGVISWSEIGLGYFIVNLFILLLLPNLTP